MSITQVRPGPQELLARMQGATLYKAAAQEGMSLSAFLERQDPSARYREDNDGLDAFGRVMRAAGIVTRSDPGMGYYADTLEAFDASEETRALLPEWAARQWRRVSMGAVQTRAALYGSQDYAVNSWMHPYADQATLRMSQLAPAIPTSELIAITTPIRGTAYRSAWLEDDATQSRMRRVGQGAELPRVKLTTSERTVVLYKYGVAMELTYEVMREQRIDMVALHIARLAIQAEIDKLAAILDVVVNGDGNSGTAAANYNLTALDAATTANNLTLLAWLAFKLKWANPYSLTHLIAQDAGILKLQTLNLGSANVPLVTVQAASGFGGLQPINPQLSDTVRIGNTSAAPSGVLVGLDARFAVERVTEIGSVISETERFVMKQTQAVTLSEVEGYGVLDKNAAKTLTLGA